METIKTGICKPMQEDKATVIGKSVEYGVTTPVSSFDKRADQGMATYVGPSKRDSSPKMGNSQTKKHKSSGRGQ